MFEWCFQIFFMKLLTTLQNCIQLVYIVAECTFGSFEDWSVKNGCHKLISKVGTFGWWSGRYLQPPPPPPPKSALGHDQFALKTSIMNSTSSNDCKLPWSCTLSCINQKGWIFAVMHKLEWMNICCHEWLFSTPPCFKFSILKTVLCEIMPKRVILP